MARPRKAISLSAAPIDSAAFDPPARPQKGAPDKKDFAALAHHLHLTVATAYMESPPGRVRRIAGMALRHCEQWLKSSRKRRKTTQQFTVAADRDWAALGYVE